MTKQRIFIGADHGGFEMKEALKIWLEEQQYQVQDVGALHPDPEDDYPPIAFSLAQQVAQNPESVGILCCRSAAGMVIAANKVDGCRAVAARDAQAAEHAREHNNANIIALSGDWLDHKTAQTVLKHFLQTPFSNEPRHHRRLAQIQAYEQTE